MLGAVLACLTAAAAISLPAAPPTAVAVPNSFVTGWVPHWERTDGIAAINSAGSLFGEVMPFWYSAKSDGSVSLITGTSSTALRDVARAARAKSQRVTPSIVDATGKGVLAAILLDPARRAAHIQSIVSVVNTGIDGKAYDGIDIDYEGFAFTDGRATWAATQPGWIAFVKELGAALRANGKTLSITVPPTWSSTSVSYWVYGPCPQAEVFDFAACAPKWADLMPSVDRWRLMVYDYSFSLAGPTAPLHWAEDTIDYVKKTVPPSELGKVQLGVPAYGYSWGTKVSGTCPNGASLSRQALTPKAAADLAAARGATMTTVATNAAGRPIGEKTFSYEETLSGASGVAIDPPAYLPPPNRSETVAGPADPTGLKPALRLSPSGTTACVVKRTVWVSDTASIVQRVNWAQAAGLGGAVIWALGYETPDLWPALR